MRISPLDIRKQSFKGKLRGVDPEEVRIFLDVVASEYEQVLQENAMLVERLRSYEARLVEYQKVEANMRDALVKMEQFASESRESAEQRSRRLLQEAHGRAERIVEDARERLQSLIREIEMLRGKKEIFARRFWTLIEGQIAVLQEHMTDSVEVDTLRQKIARMAADARAAAAADLGAYREATVPAAVPEDDSPRPVPGGGSRDRGWAAGSAAEPRPAPEPVAAPEFREAPSQSRPGADSSPAPSSAGFWDRSGPAGPPSRPPFAEGQDGRVDARLQEPDRAEVPAGRAHPSEPGSPETGGEAARRRSVPKGLRNLLRGRQAQLPLGDGTLGGGFAPSRDGTDEAPAPSVERREGFFELRAGGASVDGPPAGRRGGNGSDRT